MNVMHSRFLEYFRRISIGKRDNELGRARHSFIETNAGTPKNVPLLGLLHGGD